MCASVSWLPPSRYPRKEQDTVGSRIWQYIARDMLPYIGLQRYQIKATCMRLYFHLKQHHSNLSCISGWSDFLTNTLTVTHELSIYCIAFTLIAMTSRPDTPYDREIPRSDSHVLKVSHNMDETTKEWTSDAQAAKSENADACYKSLSDDTPLQQRSLQEPLSSRFDPPYPAIALGIVTLPTIMRRDHLSGSVHKNWY